MKSWVLWAARKYDDYLCQCFMWKIRVSSAFYLAKTWRLFVSSTTKWVKFLITCGFFFFFKNMLYLGLPRQFKSQSTNDQKQSHPDDQSLQTLLIKLFVCGIKFHLVCFRILALPLRSFWAAAGGRMGVWSFQCTFSLCCFQHRLSLTRCAAAA